MQSPRAALAVLPPTVTLMWRLKLSVRVLPLLCFLTPSSLSLGFRPPWMPAPSSAVPCSILPGHPRATQRHHHRAARPLSPPLPRTRSLCCPHGRSGPHHRSRALAPCSHRHKPPPAPPSTLSALHMPAKTPRPGLLAVTALVPLPPNSHY
jgi:hypothetical protein